jgi:hypothetical protein
MPPDLLVDASTADLLDIVESRCRLSNHCIVVLIDSAWSSEVGSNPSSKGVSSSNDSLVTKD